MGQVTGLVGFDCRIEDGRLTEFDERPKNLTSVVLLRLGERLGECRNGRRGLAAVMGENLRANASNFVTRRLEPLRRDRHRFGIVEQSHLRQRFGAEILVGSFVCRRLAPLRSLLRLRQQEQAALLFHARLDRHLDGPRLHAEKGDRAAADKEREHPRGDHRRLVASLRLNVEIEVVHGRSPRAAP